MPARLLSWGAAIAIILGSLWALGLALAKLRDVVVPGLSDGIFALILLPVGVLGGVWLTHLAFEFANAYMPAKWELSISADRSEWGIWDSYALKSTLWGIVAVVGGFLFWLWLIGGNPLDELALIRSGKTIPGFAIDSWEEAESGDEGGTQWLHRVTYEYTLPDGRKITQRTPTGVGRLDGKFDYIEEPIPLEVEYVPDDPQTSRIKGSGNSTIWEWLIFKGILGSLLLALFLSPGGSMLVSGYREARTLLAKSEPSGGMA